MDGIEIAIAGQGGHGGIPHQAADPIVAAAVVTIGTIHGGTAFNIIPDRVEMLLLRRRIDEPRARARWPAPHRPV